jgi:hypothetical protein
MARDELLEDIEMLEAVCSRMRSLLADIAVEVKGPAPLDKPHDWGDLPELIHKLVAEHKHLKDWWAEHVDTAAQSYEEMASNMAAVRKVAVAEGFRMGVTATLQRLEGRVRALPDPDVIDAEEV